MVTASCAISHTASNEQLILSLLDRYIDVTNISFGSLSRKFYEYTPDELEDLKYHGRQVSFYMKRERPISPHHWYGVAEFVFSDEFIDAVPEARVVIRQKESAIEAGVYFSKLNGLIGNDYNGGPFPLKYSGSWSGSNGNEFYIQQIEGHSFAIFHGVSIESPAIFSGFVFPTQRNFEELKEVSPPLKSISGLEIFEVYIWDRLSRKKAVSEIYPLFFQIDTDLFVTSLSLDPEYLEQDLDESMEIPMRDSDVNGNFYISKVIKNKAKNWRESSHLAFRLSDFNGEALTNYIESKTCCSDSSGDHALSFLKFIDSNLWGVLGDGSNC